MANIISNHNNNMHASKITRTAVVPIAQTYIHKQHYTHAHTNEDREREGEADRYCSCYDCCDEFFFCDKLNIEISSGI